MKKQELQSTLAELHEALSTHEDELDEDTQELLETLTADIQQVLAQREPMSQESLQPLSRRLRESLLQFETEHPQLTGIVGRIADGLAALGI